MKRNIVFCCLFIMFIGQTSGQKLLTQVNSSLISLSSSKLSGYQDVKLQGQTVTEKDSYKYPFEPNSSINVPLATGYTCFDSYEVEQVMSKTDPWNKSISGNRSPGDELISAGRLILTGIAITLITPAPIIYWANTAPSPRSEILSYSILIIAGITALGFEIGGVSKLIQAGKKLNIGIGEKTIGIAVKLQ